MPAIAKENFQTARQSFLEAKSFFKSNMYGPMAHDASKALRAAEIELQAARNAYVERPQVWEVSPEDLEAAGALLGLMFEVDGDDPFRIGRRWPR